MFSWRIVERLSDVDKSSWDALAYGGNPFLSYTFLNNLETSRSLERQRWQPIHIIVEENNTLVGAMPLYIKQDSFGEFVFDWAWADACQRAGQAYYPKLVSAIPFTPVSGARLLIHPNAENDAVGKQLIKAALALIEENRFSSLHILFPREAPAAYASLGGLTRLTCQYHWFNQGYADFQDFLGSLTSKKRKQIARERRAVRESGISIECLSGDQITQQQWQCFYEFYCSTFYKKWGEPRLALDFFIELGNNLPQQTLLFMARQGKEYIAGAFAMRDKDTLYGRHWGCRGHVPCLHFELCYYQTIDYAIKHRIKKLDAGVQGEHKLARGFLPVAMHSAHWIREDGFRHAVRDYLQRETPAIESHIDEQRTHLPYRQEQITS